MGIIKKIKPRLVLTTGGFAAGALGLAASMTNTPLAIIEPNAYPGLTNRYLGVRASIIFTAYKNATAHFPNDRTHTFGAPARRDVIARNRVDARSELGISDDTIIILAMGGSQGAVGINRSLPDAMKIITEKDPGFDFRIFHQCGRGKTDRVKIDRGVIPENRYEVVEFIEDVPTYLAAADIVVTRAGASSLAEIACRGLPALIIPYPHSSENHQVANAKTWENAGAAFCIEENDLSPPELAEKLLSLMTDPNKRETMVAAAKQLGDPSAAERIAELLEKYITAVQNK